MFKSRNYIAKNYNTSFSLVPAVRVNLGLGWGRFLIPVGLCVLKLHVGSKFIVHFVFKIPCSMQISRFVWDLIIDSAVSAVYNAFRLYRPTEFSLMLVSKAIVP